MSRMWLIWLIPIAVVAGLIWAALETGGDMSLWLLVPVFLIAWVFYGAFLLIMWVLPFVLIGCAVLAGMWFLRKLVLDAVKEARRDPAQHQ